MTQFRPCKTCWHKDGDCPTREKLRSEIGYMESTPLFPSGIQITNVNFQC